jgi:hypothetical protein
MRSTGVVYLCWRAPRRENGNREKSSPEKAGLFLFLSGAGVLGSCGGIYERRVQASKGSATGRRPWPLMDVADLVIVIWLPLDHWMVGWIALICLRFELQI